MLRNARTTTFEVDDHGWPLERLRAQPRTGWQRCLACAVRPVAVLLVIILAACAVPGLSLAQSFTDMSLPNLPRPPAAGPKGSAPAAAIEPSAATQSPKAAPSRRAPVAHTLAQSGSPAPSGTGATPAAPATTAAGGTPSIITVIAGSTGETTLTAAQELASVLDGADGRPRLVAVTGRGGTQNGTDLVQLKGIDAAIMTTDALARLVAETASTGVGRRLVPLARLFHEEVHVLAGDDIGTLADLAGRRVAVGPRGGTSAVTADRLFAALGITIAPVHAEHAEALARLAAGELDAAVIVSARPVPVIAQSEVSLRRLHLLPIPYSPALETDFIPARIGRADYPEFGLATASIETVAVGAVLVGYDWPAGHPRRATTAALVEALRGALPVLRRGGRHPKWAETTGPQPLRVTGQPTAGQPLTGQPLTGQPRAAFTPLLGSASATTTSPSPAGGRP
ncbi:MAG: TAXI family TRAP transporter solute-binding subunit [Hyphomicrobiaceae bacterium]|nr:TAXI family TRAP transporter solute-binding subunit [Hyphomicrobiaceae bacterium]